MSGNNGRTYGQDAISPETAPAEVPKPDLITLVPNPRKIGLALFPLSPVKFSGDEAVLAWGRILLYGGIAYLAWGKSKFIAYSAAGAAGACAISSLTATAWDGKK